MYFCFSDFDLTTPSPWNTLLTIPFRPRGAPVSSPVWSGMRRTRRDCGPFARGFAVEANPREVVKGRTIRDRGGRPKDPAMRRRQAFSQGAKRVAPLGVAS